MHVTQTAKRFVQAVLAFRPDAVSGKRGSLLLCCLLAGQLLAVSAAFADAKLTIHFGIGPQQSPSELARHWGPVLRYWSEKTGYEIRFGTARNIPAFQQQMHEGRYDMANINPYHYTLFRKSAGYDVFAQEKGATLTGVLVVRKDSAYRGVLDLHGKSAAFPAPTAIVAAVLPLAYLKSKNVQVRPSYVVSHHSVYLGVARGLYDVGGGELRTLDGVDREIREQLRVLWTAPALPPFVFAAHPRVPKEVVERMKQTMFQMERDPQGRRLLEALRFEGITAATDADYDVVRRLDVRESTDR